MLKKKKKSQISVDFMIIIAIAIFVFLVMFALVNRRNNDLQSLQTTLYARQLADKVATEINTVFLAGDGTTKTIEIPETLKDETSYTLKVYPEERIVNIMWTSKGSMRQYSSPVVTGAINGNLTLVFTQQISFTNTNGNVTVEAEFDTTPPVISNVKNTSITGSSALITWDTDESANSTLNYNTFFRYDVNFRTSHSILLTGLEPSTNYYYNITACDKYGNCAVSDQYWFTTLTPQSGSTVNGDFLAGLSDWDFYDWDKDGDESDPTGNLHGSGGDPGNFVSVLIPSGSEDEVGGYWEQSFVVTAPNPKVNCSFDFRIVAYEADPILYNISIYLDNSSGVPSNLIWANTSITSTSLWSGVKSVNCTGLITNNGTYYYKLAGWVETGVDPKGSFTVGYDNAKVEWTE